MEDNMTTYKLFRTKNGKLYPLFVDANSEMVIGEQLYAKVGDRADDTHVKSRLGALSLRPGFHSTQVPFTDWIGKKQNGRLVQRKNTVWCECTVTGTQQTVTNRNGLRQLPDGWYFFKTKPRQPFPWIISNTITINRVLSNDEVGEICRQHGVEPQEVEV
jgi:hypothetical protein